MPEITTTGILITLGLNIVSLLLLAYQQNKRIKPVQPNAKKRMSMGTIAYMLVASNMFIFAYIWREFIDIYVQFNNFPLSLSLGVMGGCVLAFWLKKKLTEQAKCALEDGVKFDLVRYSSGWHRLYFLQSVTIFGALLMLLEIEMMVPFYVLIVSAGILANIIHLADREWKNALFQFFYSALWMLVLVLSSDMFSALVALVTSYTLIRVLISKHLIKV